MASDSLSDSELTIYSTYPEFEYEYATREEPETLPPCEQQLVVSLEKRKLDGAVVTRISGFTGKRVDLINLGRRMQEACKTCVSSRMYQLTMNRDVRNSAYVYLKDEGFNVEKEES